MKIFFIALFIIIILAIIGGYFALKTVFKSLSFDEIFQKLMGKSTSQSICNLENGEVAGADCRFLKDPAQVRYEETGECGSDLEFNCNGGKYSKYKNGCYGKNYYDYSKSNVSVKTELVNGQCVNSGDICRAVICENDKRCGGENDASQCKEISAEVAANSFSGCTEGFKPMLEMAKSNSVKCDFTFENGGKGTLYAKHGKAYYDLIQGNNRSEVIWMQNGFNIKIPANAQKGPFAQCNWLFFGCGADALTGGLEGGTQLDVMLKQQGFSAVMPQDFVGPKVKINCVPAQIDELKFATPGKTCDFVEIMGSALKNLPIQIPSFK